MGLVQTQQIPESSTWDLSKDEVFAGLGYTPHPKQRLMHDSDARFRVVVAGRRWGKTKSAAKEADVMLLQPGTKGAVVAPNHPHTGIVFNEIVDDLLGTANLKSQVETYHKSPPLYLKFDWGSEVRGFSADNADSARGYEFDWLIFDECAQSTLAVWERVLDATLHDRNGWALFITTPQGYNYVYDFYKRGQDPDEPEWWSIQSPTWENPYHNKKRLEVARRNLTPSVLKQEYGAEFTVMAGQVYLEFNEQVHVIPHRKLKIPKEWPRWTTIDWGYEDPFVRLYITTDEQDRPIIYDEYYRRHQEPSKLIKKLSQRVSRKNKDSRGRITMVPGWGNKYTPKFDTIRTEYKFHTCDPSRPESRATFAAAGIYCIPVRTKVLEDGLDDVRSLLIREDNTPGMFVSSKCVETIKEFNLYSYPSVDSDRSAGNPIDAYNHCMDAFRYWVQYTKRGRIKQYGPGNGVRF